MVRDAMFNQHEISEKEHIAWFQRLQSDKTQRWFLYFDESDMPCGVVYFTNLDLKQRLAFWGFYAKPDSPPGVGMRLSLVALNYAFYRLGLFKVCAEVLENNKRSLIMHSKIGFTEEGRFREHYFDGQHRLDIIRLAMFASDWAYKGGELEKKHSHAPAPPRLSIAVGNCNPYR